MSSSAHQSPILHFGPFDLDLTSAELSKYGTRIRLQEQPFQILAMLAERPGEVVTRDELRQRLWPADTFVDFNHGLNNAVLRLREVLGDSADAPRYIETIPRRGYRFIAKGDAVSSAPLRPIQSSTDLPTGIGAIPSLPGSNGAAAPKPDISEMRVPSIQRRANSRTAIVVSAALILVLIAVSVGALLVGGPANTTKIQSIAVLPLENVSGDATQEYFADGMTDALITNLAQLGSFRVISRTSAMHYKNSRQRLPEIAREVNVDAVVEGTVSKTGAHVHINAQLVDARNDRHLWAEAYDRDVQDVVALQGELATAIAARIAGRILPQRQARLRMKQVNPEAYEAYLRGRYFWNKRTEEGFIKAIGFFEQAIAKEPDYAQAYAGLSDTYALLGRSPQLRLARSEKMARARAAALRALEIDDTVAEAHTSLASISMLYDWNWSFAEKEFRRAIELDPGYATAHHWYAFYCAAQGRTDEALREIRIAHDLDPLSLIINVDVAHLLYFARRYDEAIAQSRRALELDPNLAWPHVTAGLAYLGKQQYPQALAELETAVRKSRGNPGVMAFLGIAYAEAGRKEDALRIIKEIRTASSTRNDPVLKVAWIYAALGDRDRAFAWADKVYATRSIEFYTLKVLPVLDPWRTDPRFQDLIRRVGLSP